jgi:hypothetical protein
MRRCKRLRRLRKTLNRRVARLERRTRAIAGVVGHKDRDMVVAHVAIEALNAWTVFSRSYYLSCALGALTERKKYVTIAPTADPIGAAITCINRWARPTAVGAWHRRDEPAWHDPNVLMRVCGNVSCSIQTEIGAAFSLNQNVFNHLPVFRNFFAHRNGDTSRAARSIAARYTLPSHLSPTELLLSVSPGATETVLVDWLAEILITAEFLCKA